MAQRCPPGGCWEVLGRNGAGLSGRGEACTHKETYVHFYLWAFKHRGEKIFHDLSQGNISTFLCDVLDPDKGCQYLCDHTPVSSTSLPKNETGAEETKLCDTNKLPGAGVWIQEVSSFLPLNSSFACLHFSYHIEMLHKCFTLTWIAMTIHCTVVGYEFEGIYSCSLSDSSLLRFLGG